jgi:glyoxylase-like metal-dependent hydrolase (beta-lactamase superfamily II)
MASRQIRDNLFLIDLDAPMEGFRKFIGTWLYRKNAVTLLVDPGPASSVPILVEHLKGLGVETIDRVLLTHIHLDHAGGTGRLLTHFPRAHVICHPRGIPHLVAPQKLWEESRRVLGAVADIYGELVPVPASNISCPGTVGVGGLSIEIIETPGHAPHHLSFRVGDILFAGEVGGVYVPLDRGFHCRPATPPPFHHPIFQDSIRKLASLDVSLICLGHHGARPDGRELFERARRQLDFWVDTVERHRKKDSKPFEEAVLADLIANDPDMTNWQALPGDIRARERTFCLNSIRGIRGYLTNNETANA